MAFKIHKNFQLNGNKFKDNLDLKTYSSELTEEISEFISDFLDESETINLQTSGSTGVPKKIKVNKSYMLNSAIATGNYFDLKENTTALLCMNLKYVGAKMMLVRAMLLGWHIDIVQPSLNPLKDLNKQYEFSAMVPLQVHHSISDLPKIKTLIIGGGAVSNELKESLQNVSTNCFATYGMTETVSHIAVKKLNNFISNTERSRSVYKGLPNVSFSIDERDCLNIDAPMISDTKVVTNDIVELISATEFKWLGRYDNVINSGGVKLVPEQIEDKFSEIIHQRFFVAGIPDKVLGHKLVLIVEGKGDSNVILSGAKNLKTLIKFEIPKEVYCIPKFIETETKKIQRKKTLDLLILL